MGIGLHAMSDFNFRDLEMMPSRSSGVNFVLDSESPISTSQMCLVSRTV